MSEPKTGVEVKEFDPGTRKLLFYGYIVRVIGDLFSYIAGLGYILTGLGWFKCYSKVLKKSVFILASILGVAAGIVSLYNVYTGLAAYTTFIGGGLTGNVTLSSFKEAVVLTANAFSSLETCISNTMLGLLFIIDGLAIFYLMKEFRGAFNAFTWILLFLAGLTFLGMLGLAPHTSSQLMELANKIDAYIKEFGDQPITPETAHFVGEYLSIIMPISSIVIVGLIMRIIGHVLAILGFNKIPKVIEKMKILSEALESSSSYTV